MELNDLLGSDTLECCEHMTDENTSEGDQSLDNLLLAAYDSISEPLEATLGDEHGREASERPLKTTDSTPSLLRACANAPSQPHPSPPAPPPSRFAAPVTDDEVLERRESAIPTKTAEDTKYCTKVWQQWSDNRNQTHNSQIPHQLLVGGTQFVHCREVVSVHYRRFHCTLLVSSLCIYLTVDYEITTLYALKTFPLYIHQPYIPYSLTCHSH